MPVRYVLLRVLDEVWHSYDDWRNINNGGDHLPS